MIMLDKKNFNKNFTKLLPGIGLESRVYFEELSMDGLVEMHKYSTNERLYEFFEYDPFTEVEDTRRYIEKLLKRMSKSTGEQTAMYWFVRRKADDYLVGTAGLTNFNWDRLSIEQGYGIDPEFWGNGYILEMQEILKHYVFEVLELNRLNGITMVKNERTIQSILASGMKHEGVLQDYYCKDGIYIDGWQYGMTAKGYFKNDIKRISMDISEADIIKVVSSVLNEEDINVASSMDNTFSWDSLNHMSIIIALKNNLSVDFSPSDIANATSIKKIHGTFHGKS